MLLRELPLTLLEPMQEWLARHPACGHPSLLGPVWGRAGTQGTGLAFLPPNQCPFGSCQCPLTLFATALSPS